MSTYSQWSTLTDFPGDLPESWVPESHKERCRAYTKYDQMYWNDPRQYALRVLEGENPIYIPNARTIIDTTAHYLLKDISVGVEEPAKHVALVDTLKNFLAREVFEARFQTAKHTGVAHGDFVFHMTANPRKLPGSRVSLTPIDPGIVFPEWDEDSPDKLSACNLVRAFNERDSTGELKTFVKVLTYKLVETEATRRVFRVERVYNMDQPWYGERAEEALVNTTLPPGLLPNTITSIPIYWFKNTPWNAQEFGSSELRGIETILQSISQGSTDTQGALALEGLGVYATDGGRPINDEGEEVDWEIAPGRVMEVPIGSKFWRVQGVGSITPMKDQLERLENKLQESSALTAVALGKAAVNVASSGIALAIQFTPTLAKIEERDKAGIAKLNQMFYDWKTWHTQFEADILDGDILVELGAKLPLNRTETLNELNQMLDRRVISTQYYREAMTKLGYLFPADISVQITEDIEMALKTTPISQTDQGTIEKANQSNNSERPNESSGSEVNSDGETPEEDKTP